MEISGLLHDRLKVAPYLGAWIEIFATSGETFNISVAPYLGAWIEIGFVMLLKWP